MQAIILAGGLGTRLRPYTYKIPKPMIPINGKPFLFYLVKYLEKNGIRDIILSIGYLGEHITNYFKEVEEELNVSINYSNEEKLLGTGGAIKLAEKFLEDRYFIIYGDSYLPEDYQKIFKFFVNSQKELLIVGYNNVEDTDVKNNLKVDEKSNIVISYKKNSSDKSLNYVDAGVLVASKELLKYIPKNEFVSLEEDIFPVLINQRKMICYKTNNRFYDIGTPERIKIFERYVNDNFKNTI